MADICNYFKKLALSALILTSLSAFPLNSYGKGISEDMVDSFLTLIENASIKMDADEIIALCTEDATFKLHYTTPTTILNKKSYHKILKESFESMDSFNFMDIVKDLKIDPTGQLAIVKLDVYENYTINGQVYTSKAEEVLELVLKNQHLRLKSLRIFNLDHQ